MKTSQAEAAFAALSQATRLAILRYLIKSGSEGVPAGVIADTLDIQPSTFSFHVAILTRARLVQARREQRQILYSPDFEGIRAVVEFLLKDCCNGRPEICSDLFSGFCTPAARVPKGKARARTSNSD